MAVRGVVAPTPEGAFESEATEVIRPAPVPRATERCVCPAGTECDRDGEASVPVTYTGAVPDPFREGREVIIDVRKDGDVFVGEKDSLVTKCPSKFSAEEQT